MLFARIILSVVAGSAIGLIAGVLSSSLATIISCGIAALIVAAIVYNISSGLKGLELLLALISGIATFFVYGTLLGYLEYGESLIAYFVPFLAPYIAAVFIYSLPMASDSTNAKEEPSEKL